MGTGYLWARLTVRINAAATTESTSPLFSPATQCRGILPPTRMTVFHGVANEMLIAADCTCRARIVMSSMEQILGWHWLLAVPMSGLMYQICVRPNRRSRYPLFSHCQRDELDHFGDALLSARTSLMMTVRKGVGQRSTLPPSHGHFLRLHGNVLTPTSASLTRQRRLPGDGNVLSYSKFADVQFSHTSV